MEGLIDRQQMRQVVAAAVHELVQPRHFGVPVRRRFNRERRIVECRGVGRSIRIPRRSFGRCGAGRICCANWRTAIGSNRSSGTARRPGHRRWNDQRRDEFRDDVRTERAARESARRLEARSRTSVRDMRQPHQPPRVSEIVASWPCRFSPSSVAGQLRKFRTMLAGIVRCRSHELITDAGRGVQGQRRERLMQTPQHLLGNIHQGKPNWPVVRVPLLATVRLRRSPPRASKYS